MQMNRTARPLPQPDRESAAHSAAVGAFIRERIDDAGGSVSFAEFMQHALYAPGLGYYVSGLRKFGRGGDFVTAPEISPLFGRVLARQCAKVLADSGGNVLELGAGSGALAATMLARLDEFDALPERYAILDVSAELRARQAVHLEQQVPQLAARVEWLEALPLAFDGVIISNEVVDALPVERFTIRGGQVLQRRVVNYADGFGWNEAPAPGFVDDAVRAVMTDIGTELPDGYVSEVCTALPPWLGDVAASLGTGLLLIFDYGVSRREYYAPDRNGGWLRCHFRHHVHDDPLVLPGIQDLTSWVDFTAAVTAAVEHGLDVAGYVTQAEFLLHGGLDAELAGFDATDAKRQVALSREVKLLTLPGEMGEHFKCLGLSRGDVVLPDAFSVRDRAHRL